MPPCPPSLGLGLGLQYYRAGGPSLDPDALLFNGVVIWFNGEDILFTNA